MCSKAVVFAAAAFFGLCSGIARADEAGAPTQEIQVAATVETASAPVNVGNKVCPVAGEKIDEVKKETVEYKGKIYNFCCGACKEHFLANPEKYIPKVEEELAQQKGRGSEGSAQNQ